MPPKAIVCLLACLLAIVSCSKENGLHPNPARYFKSVEGLVGESVLTFDDFGVFRPTSIVMREGIVFAQNRDVEMLCAVNRVSTTMESLLRRGDGPGEALHISYITIAEDAIVTAEMNKRLIIEIPLDSKKATFTPLPFEYGSPTSIIKGRDGYVILGNFPDGRYMYYQPEQGKVGFFGEYRVLSKYKRLDNYTKSLIYISSKLAIKPDLTKFVAVNFNNGVIDINGIEKDSIVNLKQLDFHYQDIYVEGSRDKPRVFTKKSNRNGFFDVATCNDYIYAIYSGKSFDEAGISLDHCEYLMVFDWDGNPAGCFHVNTPLYAICYNDLDNALYGVHLGEEATLYKFDIRERLLR